MLNIFYDIILTYNHSDTPLYEVSKNKVSKGKWKKKKKGTCTHIERLLTENKDIRILWVRLKAKEKEFTGK